MDDDKWPPEWGPIEESPQYRYRMILTYMVDSDDDEEEYGVPDDFYSFSDERIIETHEALMKFLDQVRESRGYDVDCFPPRGYDSPLWPVDMSEVEDFFRNFVMKATQFAIDEINAQSEKRTGKTYKLKDLEKVVQSRNLMLLLTYTATEVVLDADADVKTFQAMVYSPPSDKFELIEWRFKPEPAASKGA